MTYLPGQVITSTVNSSTTPLGAGATFTGTGELNNAPDIMVSCQTDQAGTLEFEFSVNGTDWGSFPVGGFSVVAGIHEFHTAVKGPRYFRVKFTNDSGSLQTYLRLTTYYGTFAGKPNAPISQTINSDSDATVVKAVLVGETPVADTFANQKVGGVSSGNSSTTPLGISGSFNGTWEDVSTYAGITVLADGTSAGTADGTMYMEFSHDGVTTHRSIQIDIADITNAAPRTLGVVANYFQVRYDNGTTAQSTFDLQTMYHTEQVSLVSRLNQTLGADSDVTNVRAVSTGEQPDGAFANEKVSGSAFSTTTPLNNGVTYDSGVLENIGYQQLQTNVLASHDGQLTFTFYEDSGGTDVVRTLSLPYVAANGYQQYSAPTFSKYVRYEFLNNSGSNQTDFYYETLFLTNAVSPQLLRLDAPMAAGMIGQMNRAVIVGQDSAGNFRNQPTDSEGHIKVNIHDPRTAFGDLRVAELTPKVHLTFPYNINGDIVSITETNSGTVTQADSMVVLQTSTNAAGDAILESRRVLTYRSGLGANARFTALFTTGVASSTQIIGVGDAEDGFFFGYNGDTFGILRRQDGVDNWIAQTAWNVDHMDGVLDANNPSGMNLTHTNINVFQIQYQWLGAGQIEFSIEDEATGLFVPVHRISYANQNTVPSIYNANLPLYAQAINSGNTTNLTMKSASMAGFVEGKSIRLGPTNNFSNSNSHNAETALFHLRNVTSLGGITNRVRVLLQQMSVGNDANQLATFKIYLNATLAGVATWNTVNGTDSMIESDVVQTYTSGGRVLFTGTVGKDSGEIFDLSDLEVEIVPGDIITVTSAQGGSAALMEATLVWQEDF